MGTEVSGVQFHGRERAETADRAEGDNTLQGTNPGTDAAEAAKFFAQLSPKGANAALQVVVKGLPEGAVPAVRDYALTLPAGDARAALLGSVAQTMLLENPAAADGFIASLPPGERFKGMHDYWEMSAAGDPAKTAAQFVRMRAEAGADAASDLNLADILQRGSMRFPAKGAEAALLLDPKERDELLDSLAPQWVSRDPQAAFAWAANVADAGAQASAIYKIAAHAAEHDATQAAQWAEQLPAGPARDSAARAMAEQVFDTDPDGALTWARSLSTGKGRIAALLSAVSHWRERTTTAAWLKSAPLSAEERAALKRRDTQPPEE